MSNSKYFTNGTDIFRVQGATVTLENIETGKTVKVECQDGGRLEGFEPMELSTPKGRPGPRARVAPADNSTVRKPRKIRAGASSQYHGVSLDKSSGKWKAQIYLGRDKGLKWGGLFENEIEAAKRVDQVLAENNMSKVNFP